MTELMSASGPDRYFGGTIETFALPMGAFIIIALLLFYLYRRPHNVPRLKYLRPAHQTAFGTREPGTAGLISLAAPKTAKTPNTPSTANTETTPAADSPAADGAAGNATAAESETP